MQVEEEYNPVSARDFKVERVKYHERQRNAARRGSGAAANDVQNSPDYRQIINNVRPSIVAHESQKPRKAGKVKYIFLDAEDGEGEAADQLPECTQQ